MFAPLWWKQQTWSKISVLNLQSETLNINRLHSHQVVGLNYFGPGLLHALVCGEVICKCTDTGSVCVCVCVYVCVLIMWSLSISLIFRLDVQKLPLLSYLLCNLAQSECRFFFLLPDLEHKFNVKKSKNVSETAASNNCSRSRASCVTYIVTLSPSLAKY